MSDEAEGLEQNIRIFSNVFALSLKIFVSGKLMHRVRNRKKNQSTKDTTDEIFKH